MILFPAIDIKDGCAVRLLHGRMDKSTVYNESPADQAAAFASTGFEWLHVVDLDGAVAGRPVNEVAIKSILATVELPIQLGGGIRDLSTIEHWLAAGVARVVLGTAAVRDPALVREACRSFPQQIAVGLDARDRRVAVDGWAATSDKAVIDVARSFEDVGVASIVYTDIERDGALRGLNIDATVRLAEIISVPVIASGGIASLDDIARLISLEEIGIAGVICGRALYEGTLDPRSALALVRGRESA
jgi:phosphoribosylformimino-5-aminoimidazole carboxamide ribotide isomerase